MLPRRTGASPRVFTLNLLITWTRPARRGTARVQGSWWCEAYHVTSSCKLHIQLWQSLWQSHSATKAATSLTSQSRSNAKNCLHKGNIITSQGFSICNRQKMRPGACSRRTSVSKFIDCHVRQVITVARHFSVFDCVKASQWMWKCLQSHRNR